MGMGDEDRPLSAVEIAMARMKARDREHGEEVVVLTDEQKAQIADARSMHASKVAQLEILHASKGAVLDPDERGRLEAEYRDELRRLGEDLERRIDKIRRAGRD